MKLTTCRGSVFGAVASGLFFLALTKEFEFSDSVSVPLNSLLDGFSKDYLPLDPGVLDSDNTLDFLPVHPTFITRPVPSDEDSLPLITRTEPRRTGSLHSLAKDIRPNSSSLEGEPFYAGYVTVTDDDAGEMFYWYFPPRHGKQEEQPFVIWLSGGPGCSSSFAELAENGPLKAIQDGKLVKNQFAWNEVSGIAFIDQPLGTGFSRPGRPGNYAVNEKTVATDLRNFLVKFTEIFPEVRGRPFYITGESYAGHYIPVIAHHLLEDPIEVLPLSGIAIGNGWIDPATQYGSYPDFAIHNRLCTVSEYLKAQQGIAVCLRLLASHMWPLAFVSCNMASNRIMKDHSPYDIRITCSQPPCIDFANVSAAMNSPHVQEALHISNETWHDCDTVVYFLLAKDMVHGYSKTLASVVDSGIKVMMYHGDQDFICNWEGGLKVADALPWSKRAQFNKVKLGTWKVGNQVGGQFKSLDNFAYFTVANAGHMVPMDQPAAGLEILKILLTGSNSTWTSSSEQSVVTSKVPLSKRIFDFHAGIPMMLAQS